MAFTNAGRISAAEERSTLARTSRSAISRSTRSPAREASAASSSAASIAWSSLGWSPTRPAEVRPESSTISTCRSRSGRQVRTTTVVDRAVPRQSMERTSSPGTYSRRLSNSVPWPRCRMVARPSSSRSRASRLGRCLRAENGGSARTVHGASCSTWRPATPSGPSARITTGPARRSPRRVGRRVRSRRPPLPGGDPYPLHAAAGAGGRRPGVADRAGQVPAAEVGQRQLGVRLLAQPDRGVAAPADAGPGRGGAQRRSSADDQHQHRRWRSAQAGQGRRPPPRTTGPRQASSPARQVSDPRMPPVERGTGRARWPGSTRSPSRW